MVCVDLAHFQDYIMKRQRSVSYLIMYRLGGGGGGGQDAHLKELSSYLCYKTLDQKRK